jgi:hypothetical protein
MSAADTSPSSSSTVPIFAILVGIDTYSPPFTPLNKAVGDVNKLKRLLMDHPQIKLKEKDIKVLTNGDATRESIIEALSSLPKGLPRNNSVLFYFSGYSGSANDSGVLCPVDSFEPEVGTISDKMLIRLFESMSLSISGNIVSDLDREHQKLTLIATKYRPFSLTVLLRVLNGKIRVLLLSYHPKRRQKLWMVGHLRNHSSMS